jgi:hypothetical protein
VTNRLVASKKINTNLEGAKNCSFLYSFSGALIAEDDLCHLQLYFDGILVTIRPPFRLAHPAHRPHPQLDGDNYGCLFAGDKVPHPLQISAFPTISEDGTGALSFWNGPGYAVASDNERLPLDSIRIDFQDDGSKVDIDNFVRFFLSSFFQWLRIETGQWWAGRSYEGVIGGVHFVIFIDEDGKTIKKWTPVSRAKTGSDQLKPVTRDTWIKCGDYAAQSITTGSRGLISDAEYLFAIGEVSSAVIMACAACESARDDILLINRIKIYQLGVSSTDFLKHITVGFERKLGRNMEKEEPECFSFVKSLWVARGEAAHGREVFWHVEGQPKTPIRNIEIEEFTAKLSSAYKWFEDQKA